MGDGKKTNTSTVGKQKSAVCFVSVCQQINSQKQVNWRVCLHSRLEKHKEHLSPPKKKKRKQVYAQRGRRDCPEKQNKNFLDSSTVVFFWKIISWLSVTPKTTRKTHTKLQHGGHKLTHTYTCNTHWCEMCVRHTWSNYVGSGWWLLVEVEVVGGGGEMGGRVWCTKLTT